MGQVLIEFLFEEGTGHDLVEDVRGAIDEDLNVDVDPSRELRDEEATVRVVGDYVDFLIVGFDANEEERLAVPYHNPYIEIQLGEDRLYDKEDSLPLTDTSDQRLQELLDVVKTAYEAVAPACIVYGISPGNDVVDIGHPVPEDNICGGELNYLEWVLILPPNKVEAIGRERLLSADIPQVDELEDGSIFLLLNHPLDPEFFDIGEQLSIPTWKDLRESKIFSK